VRPPGVNAIAQLYAEDAQLYIPEAPVLSGRSAIGRAWKDNVGSGGNRLRVDVAEVEQRGDRAHEVGRFTISGPDGAVIAAGTQIVIWARQSGGDWKTRRAILNWDIAPRQP
jgi:ketosteroid isomerase-like protein